MDRIWVCMAEQQQPANLTMVGAFGLKLWRVFRNNASLCVRGQGGVKKLNFPFLSVTFTLILWIIKSIWYHKKMGQTDKELPSMSKELKLIQIQIENKMYIKRNIVRIECISEQGTWRENCISRSEISKENYSR